MIEFLLALLVFCAIAAALYFTKAEQPKVRKCKRCKKEFVGTGSFCSDECMGSEQW